MVLACSTCIMDGASKVASKAQCAAIGHDNSQAGLRDRPIQETVSATSMSLQNIQLQESLLCNSRSATSVANQLKDDFSCTHQCCYPMPRAGQRAC